MRRTRSQQRIDKALHRLRVREQNATPKAEVKRQWFKWPSRPIDIVRLIEFASVLAAITVVGYDFLIEKPRDRAVRFATLANQVAAARASNDKDIRRSAAITVAALAREGFSLKDINMSRLDFSGLDMRGGDFKNANMRGSYFGNADLSYSDFSEANLSGALFYFTKAKYTKFGKTNFYKAALIHSEFDYSLLDKVVFGDTELKGNSASDSIITFVLYAPIQDKNRTKGFLKKGFCSRNFHPDVSVFLHLNKKPGQNGIFSSCSSQYFHQTRMLLHGRVDTNDISELLLAKTEDVSQAFAPPNSPVHRTLYEELMDAPTLAPLPDWFPYTNMVKLRIEVANFFRF